MIELRFPLLSGGEEEGINDAGIETFGGDIGYYVARECAQNAIDASKNGIVELHFNLEYAEKEIFPCISELQKVMSKCKQYWSNDTKAVIAFDAAIDALSKKKISILKISDYGTTGLTGGDFERSEKWYSLVRSSGACNKTGTAGGSFGIGKYAPFAASILRTIFYHTRTENGSAFQGVSRLVTHEDGQQEQTQATGYFGSYESVARKFYAVRQDEHIPFYFKRNQIGTDIYILGYRNDGENWKDNLIISALENFWPAVLFRLIEFRVGDEIINVNNIGEYVTKFQNRREFDVTRYYNCFSKGKQFSKKLDMIGEVRLFLSVEEQAQSNRVAVMRKNGMIIDKWGYFDSRKPVTGVFICDDEHGNELLRKMEPPRHDKWDQNRIPEGKRIVRIIRDWIKECIKEFLPLPDVKTFELPDSSKYLPDEPDTEDDPLNQPEINQGQAIETFNTFPKTPSVSLITTAVSPQSAIPEPDGTVDGSEGEGDGTGGEEPGEKPKPENGDGINTGGKVDTSGGNKGGPADQKVNIKMRNYFNTSDQSYTVILRSDKSFEGRINFCAIGEDYQQDDILIKQAFYGTDEIKVEGNKFISVRLEPNKPEKIRIILNHNENISLGLIYAN